MSSSNDSAAVSGSGAALQVMVMPPMVAILGEADFSSIHASVEAAGMDCRHACAGQHGESSLQWPHTTYSGAIFVIIVLVQSTTLMIGGVALDMFYHAGAGMTPACRQSM